MDIIWTSFGADCADKFGFANGRRKRVVLLISGHRTDSEYRRYRDVDVEVLKTATKKIEQHHREIVEAENTRRTAVVGAKEGADDKGKPIH